MKEKFKWLTLVFAAVGTYVPIFVLLLQETPEALLFGIIGSICWVFLALFAEQGLKKQKNESTYIKNKGTPQEEIKPWAEDIGTI